MRPEIKEIKRIKHNLGVYKELGALYAVIFCSCYLCILAILAFILIIFEPGKPTNRIVRYKQFVEGFKGDKK